MLVLKIVMLFAVFGTISTIGVKISNRYTERANNLKQIKHKSIISQASEKSVKVTRRFND